VAVLWKLGCIWPTLQESVTAVSLIHRHHWCWQFVCLTDCSHCLESSPVTDTKLSILYSCGTWICAPTVFSNCRKNLQSPSTQPTFWASNFKIFYFCANKRSWIHTYSFQNFIIENVLLLYKDLWKWSISENTNSSFHKKWCWSHNLLASSFI